MAKKKEIVCGLDNTAFVYQPNIRIPTGNSTTEGYIAGTQCSHGVSTNESCEGCQRYVGYKACEGISSRSQDVAYGYQSIYAQDIKYEHKPWYVRLFNKLFNAKL